MLGVLMSRIESYLVLLVFIFIFSVAAKAEDVPESSFKGEWVQVMGTVGGIKQSRRDVNSSRFSFFGNRFSYSFFRDVDSGWFSVQGSKSQGNIDLAFDEGKAAGKTIHCLYRFKGNVLYLSILKDENSKEVTSEMQFQKKTDTDSDAAKFDFSGKYTSETYENFGPKKDVFTIEVAKVDDGYQFDYFKDGQLIFSNTLTGCSEKALRTEGYHTFAMPGVVRTLCTKDKGGIHFFYAENGIELAEPHVSPRKIYKAKFYSHLGWSIYGFKKLSQ